WLATAVTILAPNLSVNRQDPSRRTGQNRSPYNLLSILAHFLSPSGDRSTKQNPIRRRDSRTNIRLRKAYFTFF
ncbi:MAG: hypothetical protein VX035_00750, partial [Planctomycetota bacterium]|nr:hypothetical protein [Planctomycetota bacterium]